MQSIVIETEDITTKEILIDYKPGMKIELREKLSLRIAISFSKYLPSNKS